MIFDEYGWILFDLSHLKKWNKNVFIYFDENIRHENEMVGCFPFSNHRDPSIVLLRKTNVCFFLLKILFKDLIWNIYELVTVVKKLNQLARNDFNEDVETNLDEELQEINCTQDEFINLNNSKNFIWSFINSINSFSWSKSIA